jgi:hypothetical protein
MALVDTATAQMKDAMKAKDAPGSALPPRCVLTR